MELFKKIKEARQRLSGQWAIERTSFDEIQALYSTFEKDPKSFIRNVNSDNDVNALGGLFDFDAKDIMSIDGEVATISIEGPLVDKQDCASSFFGCTSYEEIILAIIEAESNEEIKSVVFDINSPGGMVLGCDNAAEAIINMEKPSEARVGGMAASAAFWLASQCDSIVATSATASFGSIGVVIEYWDNSRALVDNGNDKVCITSTRAPNKRVDALTEEGERLIRADLDEIEMIFLRRVASGRGITPSDVAAKFGQGGMFLAEKSLSVGMIDKTEFVINNNIKSKPKSNQTVESKMNLKEFLSQHPNAQNEVDAVSSEAVKVALSARNKKDEAKKEEVEKASKYLTSDYSQAVKSLAVDVIKGTKSLDSLVTAVNLIDETKAASDSKEAAKETEAIEETIPEAANGDTDQEDSYQASLKRTKNLK